MKLHEFFKEIRKAQGIKQKEVADAVTIKHPALSRFESGLSTLSVATLRRIAPLINVNPDYVTGMVNNPFLSRQLIKIYLGAYVFGYGLNPFFVFLMNSAHIDKMLLLVPPINILARIKYLGVVKNPVYAIVARDIDDNHFLFTRKIRNDFILDQDELLKQIGNMLYTLDASGRKKEPISYEIKKIDQSLYERIKRYTVVKEDIVPLFESLDKKDVIPSAEEKKLISFMRGGNFSPKDVIKILKKESKKP